MRTKNSKPMTKAEAQHVAAVKLLACSVCDAAGPSDAHHVNQDQHWTCIALCRDCHMGSENGIHGRRTMWRVMKLDEWGALAITLERLAGAA